MLIEPDRPFGPAAARIELVDMGVAVDQLAKPLVDNLIMLGHVVSLDVVV